MKKNTLLLFLILFSSILYSQSLNPVYRSMKNEFHPSQEIQAEIIAPQTTGVKEISDLGNPPDRNWVKQFGGDGADVGQDIVTDAAGNSYVTGYFSGPVNFGTVILTSTGYTDGFLAKFSSTGNLIWMRQLSCEPYSIVRSLGITLDEGGYVYITGSFNGAVLQIGTYTLQRTGVEDLFVAKYDSSGMPVMATHYGIVGGTIRQGKSIAVDGEGNCYVVNGSYAAELYGGYNLSKFDHSGYFQWEYENGAWFMDVKYHAGSSGDAGEPALYLTGYIDSDVIFGNTTLTTTDYSNAPFLARCNTSGTFEWAVQGVPVALGYITNYNRAYSVITDNNGDVYFSGRFEEKLVFGSDTLENSYWNNYAPFVVKCSPTGSFEWARQGEILTPSYAAVSPVNYPVDVTIDPAGNPVISCDLLNDTIAFGNIIAGGSGWVMVGYDASGNEQWRARCDGSPKQIFGTAGNKFTCTGYVGGNIMIMLTDALGTGEWRLETSGNSGAAGVVNLELDSQGNLFVYGKTDNPDPVIGAATGAFLAKLRPDGDTLWSIPFIGGRYNTTYGSFISCDQEDNVCVMGIFSDTLQIGNEMLLNTGYNDGLFIVKLNSSGVVLWLKQIGDSLTTIEGNSLATDHQNNVIASGIFYGSLTIGTCTLTDAGSGDVFVAKFDANGNAVWAERAGGDDMEWAGYVSSDGMNNIYLTGEFYSRTITIGNQTIHLTSYDGDVILIKFSPQGQMSWFQAYGGGAADTIRRYYCWPVAIRTDAGGNSYIYGWTGKSNSYGSFVLDSPYNYNLALIKTNNAGNVQWAKIIKEKRYGYHSMQIDIDGQGNCYVGGNIRDTVYFENNMVVKEGPSDLFLAKYGNSGDFIWAKLFSSNPSQRTGIPSYTNNLCGIAVYDTASLFMAGKSIYDLEVDDIVLHSSNVNGFISLIGPDIPVGMITSKANESGLIVYPNPASDIVTVELMQSGMHQDAMLSVYNMQGKKLMQHAMNGEPHFRFSLSGEPSGLYLVQIQLGNLSEIARIVKD